MEPKGFRTIPLKTLVAYTTGLSFLIFCINSVNNLNYYFPDEHFQIIEFASYKLNKTPASSLAWEYAAQERQAFQAFIVYWFFKLLDALSIQSPTNQIRALRLATCVFSVFCMYRFVSSTLDWFQPKFQRVYILSSFLIWFFPYYFVRFTSETFSQCLLLLACSFLLSSSAERRSIALGGILLGAAFFARFQTAFSLLGLLTGLYLYNQFPISKLFKIIGYSLVAVFIGIVIDRWFYGNWVLTPWNYLNYQILKSAVNQFGTSPFYQYLVDLFNFSTPVFGIIILVSLTGIVLLRKTNAVFLSFAFLLLGLSMIGHKELRFLIAVMGFLPFLVVYGIQELSSRYEIVKRALNPFLLAILFAINLGFVIVTTLLNNNVISYKPESLGYIIAKDYADKRISLFYLSKNYHPFAITGFDPSEKNRELAFAKTVLYRKFVMPADYQDFQIKSPSDRQLAESSDGRTRILYINKAEFLSDAQRDFIYKNGYTLNHRSIPAFIDEFVSKNKSLSDFLDRKITYLFVKEP